MKKEYKENIRVEVDIDERYLYYSPNGDRAKNKEKRLLTIGDEIVDQIKRHVDDVSSARVVWDSLFICSHCDYEWEENEDGLPMCCDEAEKEFEEKQKFIQSLIHDTITEDHNGNKIEYLLLTHEPTGKTFKGTRYFKTKRYLNESIENFWKIYTSNE